MMSSDKEVFWYPLAANCSIHIKPWISRHSIEIEERVQFIWESERQKNPKLFNGLIFTMSSWNEHEVTGSFCEYKYFVAASCDKSVRAELDLKPLGVSGILRAGDFVLIGKRDSHLFSRPNLYELCPSGSIDPSAKREETIDLHKQLEIELEEETHIPYSDLISTKTLALAYTPADGIWDFIIECKLNGKYPQKVIEPTHEYSEFLWHKVGFNFDKSGVVPLTRKILSELV